VATSLRRVAAPVISVRGLRMAYDGREAVRGVDLEVGAGEVFAFLGPNGAGKTTTVEILEGYRARTGGEVEVLGVDPARADRAWRARVGVVLQESEQDADLTVRETVAEYAGYYPHPRPVPETIALVGLADQAGQRAKRLSGGQQRRLDVALALIGDPDLLFLDEPTTGFDPGARRDAWEVVAGLRELGKTIFLTTHYMDEAQALADRVAVIVAGRIVASGAPDELGGRGTAASRIRFALAEDVALPALEGLEAPPARAAGRVELRTHAPVEVLNALTGWALAERRPLPGLEVSQPSLEDVYLELTARGG
jgi:ABC-2 type transport system ATP-binding protein